MKIALTVGTLVASNMFMTFAWHWHLRLQKPCATLIQGWL